MDSGAEYTVDESYSSIREKTYNSMGILANNFVNLADNIVINPSHVSSIELEAAEPDGALPFMGYLGGISKN